MSEPTRSGDRLTEEDPLRTGPDVPGAEPALEVPQAELAAGSVLGGRFVIDRLLGRGGFGHVYLGRDRVLDRPVAIKLIKPVDPTQPERTRYEAWRRDSFAEEARLGARLGAHPAVATVFDFGLHRGEPFIVFEYLPGETLRELLRRRGRLPLEEVRLIVGPLAQALTFAHEHLIVHRDLKPGNIRATEQGHFKILDLGLAREFRGASGWRFAGTPEYASPEQAAGLPCDGRSDQYALALIAYEMLAGRKIFGGDRANALDRQRSQPPPRPQELVPGLPEGVASALWRALDKDPNRRFTTCEEFARALGCSFLSVPAPLPEIRAFAAVRELTGYFEVESGGLFAAMPRGPGLLALGGLWWLGVVVNRWNDAKIRKRGDVLVAMTVDALWLWARSETLRLPLDSLVSVQGSTGGKKLILKILTPEGPVEQRLVFVDAGSCAEFSRLLSAAASETAANPVPRASVAPRVDPIVFLPQPPSARYQVLGAVEFLHPSDRHAEVGLRLRAAMMGADAVLDVRGEDLPGFETWVWRISGTAIKAVDAAGQLELRSFWYSSQVASLCRGMMAIALLPLLCLAVLFQTEARPSDPWLVPLLFAACWPLAVARLLRASLWPQLVRPAAVAAVSVGLGVGLLALPVGIDLLAGSPVAGTWEGPRKRGGVKLGCVALGAAAVALISFAVFLGERAWRIHRTFRLATGAAGGRSPLRRRVAERLATAASLATAVLAAVALAATTVAAYQRARSDRGPNPPLTDTKPRAAAPYVSLREWEARVSALDAFLEAKAAAVVKIDEADPGSPVIAIRFRPNRDEVSDDLLTHLKAFPSLRCVELPNNSKITDAGLAHLAALDQLEELNLDRTGITDAGLAHLKSLQNLRRLQVASTGVGDAGLEHLWALPNLKELNASGTKVTQAGVDDLKRRLPDIRISFGPAPKK